MPATYHAFFPADHNDKSLLVLGGMYFKERLGKGIIGHSGLAWVKLHSCPLDISNWNSNWNQTKLKPHNMKRTKNNYWAFMTLFYSVGPRAVACVHRSTTEFTSKPEHWHFYRELPAVLSCLLLLSHTIWSELLFRDSYPDAEMASMWSHFSINHF